MSHCFQFLSPDGEPLLLSELDNDIRRDVLGLPEDDHKFCVAFSLVQLLTSPGGMQPADIAGKQDLRQDVRDVALYLVGRGITARAWQESKDGRLIRRILPKNATVTHR